MKLAVLTLGAVSVAACTPLEACGLVLQEATSILNSLTHRGGTQIGVYATSTPAAGGVVVSGTCDPNATMVKSTDTATCVLVADDGECGSCLKSACCQEAIAWYLGTDPHGVEVVACVNRDCAAQCPVAK
jgi:hypothetical protein